MLETVGIGLGVMVMFVACQRPAPKPSSMPVSQTGAAALHAVQSGQLKSIMADLNGLNFDRLPQELDQRGQRQTYLENASAVASAMAEAAAKIPNTLGEVSLKAEEQEVFRALSNRLRAEAAQLSEQLRQGQTRAADSTMREINTTCVACHALFRNAPKP